jgi:hypothetical protein
MESAGHNFFSGAGFARDQNGGAFWSGEPDDVFDIADGPAFADEEALPRFAILAIGRDRGDAKLFGRHFEMDDQFILIEGSAHEMIGAQAHQADGIGNGSVRIAHQNGGAGRNFLDGVQEIGGFGTGKRKFHEEDSGAGSAKTIDGFGGTMDHLNDEAMEMFHQVDFGGSGRRRSDPQERKSLAHVPFNIGHN